jgi:hypothetical protein
VHREENAKHRKKDREKLAHLSMYGYPRYCSISKVGFR